MADMSAGPDDYSLDKFFKERLRSCHVTAKGMITGFVESKASYSELMRDLIVLGCRFSVRSTYSVKTSEAETLQYKTLSPDMQIPFTGSPFHVEGTTYFVCTHGLQYFKSKQEDDSKTGGKNPATKKKQRRINESIKLGCPAKMTVKSLRVYPDYKAVSDSWRRKCVLLKRLKTDLKSDPPPRFEMHYWFAVSQENTHNHERTATLSVQTLHPDIIAEIHRLVSRGITSVPVVKNELVAFVENMFKTASVQPDRSNTAFYPNDKAIYNHIYDYKILKAQKGAEDVKENICVAALAEENASSTVVATPQQDHQISEKCDPDLAVVPALEALEDWQDQQILPSNVVQVLNNNGTLIFMVAQPLDDQGVDRLGNATIESSTNLVNVSLDDNIYTVITDPQTESRILQLNNDSNILISQHCVGPDEIREVLTIPGDNQSIHLESHKKNSVIMGVQGASTTDCVVEDGDGDDACADDTSEFLFVEEDSQTALLMKDVKSSSKELTDLCVLPPSDSLKDNDTSLFPNALESEEPEKDLDMTCELGIKRETVKIPKNRKRLRKNSDIDEDPFQDCHPPSSILESLRDSAQDIINMSYRSSNSQLLQEIASVLEKYSKVLKDDLDLNKKLVNDDIPSLALSGKPTWKAISKVSELSDKTLLHSINSKDLHESSNCSVIGNLGRGGNIYSSESSVDDYDDLIISD
ncbi:hypothetical protein ONE63_004766 [Megalurothrips usitatus]|uniref:Uncharacterized protein n=1 Tax=Megalurothrips usitatus TaxID=439358 RepID=A0AAV7X7H9_9NEOP|nr:hypothetical protein ONE63_004766 [Megalurothrips usitatus]